jgi:hypothetical protein
MEDRLGLLDQRTNARAAIFEDAACVITCFWYSRSRFERTRRETDGGPTLWCITQFEFLGRVGVEICGRYWAGGIRWRWTLAPVFLCVYDEGEWVSQADRSFDAQICLRIVSC